MAEKAIIGGVLLLRREKDKTLLVGCWSGNYKLVEEKSSLIGIVITSNSIFSCPP